MSHLTTIIKRVKHKLNIYGNVWEAGKDLLFQQAINNLQEYQEAWNDFTKEEQKEADKLYFKYKPFCGGGR